MSLQNNQLKFIETPVSSILREAVVAGRAIGDGIETYPVNDYLLHSVFLRMTGAQEQKLKCIVWELASNDYEYRYLRYGRKPYGECSCYDEKNGIYKDLKEQISRLDPSFDTNAYLDKAGILEGVRQELGGIFRDSSLMRIHSRQFGEYSGIAGDFQAVCFEEKQETDLFASCSSCPRNGKKKGSAPCTHAATGMCGVHELLIQHRNRCAHNTTSYQRNLPRLSALAAPTHRYKNHFLYFAVLILLDRIFIKLFGKYWETIAKKIG